MSSKTQVSRKTIGLKLISVIMAVLLWLYVVNHGEITASQDLIKVDLQYQNLAEGLTVSGPDTVSVKLWGSYQQVNNIAAYVDLSGISEGSYELPVKLNPVKGAMLTSVAPDKVSLVIREMKENTVPVKHYIAQNPPPGYELLDVIIVPDKCVVKGEETVVEKVNTVTCTINLQDAKDVKSIAVPLVARDGSGGTVGEGIKMVPEKVQVYAVVGEIQNSKKVKVITEFAGSLEEGYQMGQVDTSIDTVTVLGGINIVEALNEVRTHPIDLSGKKETFSQEVEMVVPIGLKVYPSRLLVNVEIKADKNAETKKEGVE